MADDERQILTKASADKYAKQDAFLAAIADGVSTIGEAAKVAKMNRATHYLWLETDEKYAKRYDIAEERAKMARSRARAALAAKLAAKAAIEMEGLAFESMEEIRKSVETSIASGRLADGESTQNISGKLQIPERRERTPEEREANHKLLQGDDDDGDT